MSSSVTACSGWFAKREPLRMSAHVAPTSGIWDSSTLLRAIEPAGMEPAGMEPAGETESPIEPAGETPSPIDPAGIEPAGMEPAGIGPCRDRTGRDRPGGDRACGNRAGGGRGEVGRERREPRGRDRAVRRRRDAGRDRRLVGRQLQRADGAVRDVHGHGLRRAVAAVGDGAYRERVIAARRPLGHAHGHLVRDVGRGADRAERDGIERKGRLDRGNFRRHELDVERHRVDVRGSLFDQRDDLGRAASRSRRGRLRCHPCTRRAEPGRPRSSAPPWRRAVGAGCT